MKLRQLHALSAVVIMVYAAVHIANHLTALAGIQPHIAFMKTARAVYRVQVLELLLLACVAFQVLSGLVLVFRRWRQRRGLVPWLQAIAGAYLAFFLLVHVSAILFGRGVLHLDTNFYYAAAGFHVPPFQLFFAPYYFLAVVALFTHLACAIYWWRLAAGRQPTGLVIAVPATLGVAISMFIVLSLSGVFYPVDIPAEYKATYSAATP